MQFLLVLYGMSIEFLWYVYDISKGCLCSFYGSSMIVLQDFYGGSVGFLWGSDEVSIYIYVIYDIWNYIWDFFVGLKRLPFGL